MTLPTMFRTIDLPTGTLVPFSSSPGARVRIVSGRVWLTEEGNLNDVFLASGQEATLGTCGLAVIEALAPARVQLLESVGFSTRLLNAARRALQFLAAGSSDCPRRPVTCN